jgi:hypothetical protein
MKPIMSLSKARDELKLWVKRMRGDEYKSTKIQWSPSVEDCEELILAIETDLAWKGEWLLKNALAEIRNNELLGWKTVPVKATPEMLKAGADTHANTDDTCDMAYAIAINDVAEMWESMLAAAPKLNAVRTYD